MSSKIVWIASIPRTGSMWVYNVTRTLLQADGKDVQPQSIPQFDKQVAELAKKASQDNNPERVFVLKTHAHILQDIPGSVYITVERDIRDALISWMRFMHSDFDMALTTAKDMTATIDYYRTLPQNNILHIAYKTITQEPGNVAAEIAKFLAIETTDSNIQAIVDTYSKNNVAQRIQKKEQNINTRMQNNEPVSQDELFPNYDNSLRAYDDKTGFQSGHVSNYRDGDWKSILTPDQQSRMHDLLGDWLERNGYMS